MLNESNIIEKKLSSFHDKCGLLGLLFVATGQIVRHPEIVGNIEVPLFVKNHLTNAFDVVAAAPIIDSFLRRTALKNMKNSPHRMAFSIAATVGAGTLWEIYSATSVLKNGFDWMDQAMYTTSGLAYIGTHYWKLNKLNHEHASNKKSAQPSDRAPS